MTRSCAAGPPNSVSISFRVPKQAGVGLLACLACTPGSRDDDLPASGTEGTATPTATASGSATEPGATEPGATEPGATEPGETGGSETAPGGDDDDDVKLDVGVNADVATVDCVVEGDCGCTGVDLLFVIDNSGSMGDYQDGLALAFPAFAQTLSTALPPGTNVHVGVTSTEMGYSGSGSTNINNGTCVFEGDDGQSNEAFYVPPDEVDSGRNGAQGRLYDPGSGETFVAFDAGGDLSAAEAWFSSAVTIGEGGSNIEMATAPVGWAFEPVNAGTNAGFLRDDGAVLVVFFMQDEPDQSPTLIEGVPAGAWALERVAAAKAACGGLECVIAGGFLAENACSAQGNLPIDDFLAGMGETPVVAALPFFADDPQMLADDMNLLLSSALADVIAQACEDIQPEG